MNETLALPHLAGLLAQKTGIELSDAEKFIRQFFSQIESSLAVSDEVSIKGFGKFCIDSAEGVRFIPDKEFSEFLNQPFDMFSPVEIDNNADLNSDDSDVTVPLAATEPANDETPAEEEPGTPVIKEETADLEIKEEAEEDSTDMAVADASAPELHAADIPEASTEQNHVEITPDATETVAEGPVSEEPVSEDNDRRRVPVFGYILTAVVCLIIGYLARDFIVLKTDSQTPRAATDISAEAPVADSMDVITENADTTAIVEDSIPETTEEIREPVYDTVTSERFLTTMARKYYNRMEYWVFIYLANEDRLGNPNRIRPGTKVVIPDEAEFTAGETPEQTIARAERLGQEIYARFE